MNDVETLGLRPDSRLNVLLNSQTDLFASMTAKIIKIAMRYKRMRCDKMRYSLSCMAY